MQNNNLKHLSLLALCISQALYAADSVQLDTLVIEADKPLQTNPTQRDSAEYLMPSADGGDFLRSISGVSGTRMGGHGIDPIIRGQSQTRLNVLLDGAFVHGGCPNRMDPPTAYSPMETYDSVTVLKGSQTVRYGGGGSGGTVLLERNTPRLEADKSHRGHVAAGFKGNSDTRDLSADVTAGNTQGFVRGIAQWSEADNYSDGANRTVRSAYETQSGTLILGYTPDNQTRAEISLESNRADDVLFAGAGMDAPESELQAVRLRFKREALNTELYYSDVFHRMDNFSLRDLTAPMKMQVNSTSRTLGGRLHYDFKGAGWNWLVGVDYQNNQRNAKRFAGMPMASSLNNLQAIMWPEVDLQQPGLFLEADKTLGNNGWLKTGLRYDHVNASIDAGSATASGLYRMYYADTDIEQSEHNIGGFLSYSHMLNDAMDISLGVSRSVRTADATERYLAASNKNAMMRWVGNPAIKPEQHHQIEFGLNWEKSAFSTSVAMFYNQVTDYILRDRARGQAGILQSDGASIYRNVDAQLYGFEWEIQWRIDANVIAKLDTAYVHATNSDEDRPLAQTPPLEGSTSIEYQEKTWLLGSRLRFAADQTRVDDNAMIGSGLDAGESAGFGALDLYGRYQWDAITFSAGVENLFDRVYAYHVNRANTDPFNPEAVRVNEPGRSFWLNVRMDF